MIGLILVLSSITMVAMLALLVGSAWLALKLNFPSAWWLAASVLFPPAGRLLAPSSETADQALLTMGATDTLGEVCLVVFLFQMMRRLAGGNPFRRTVPPGD